MSLRLIIGFVKRLCDLDDIRGFTNPEEKALYELKRAPPPGFVGLISIVRRIHHLNAVYVDIDGDKLSDFLLACRNWDPVDYCDRNARLFPSVSYSETVPAAYRLGTDLRAVLAQEHSVAPRETDALGLGIRIGLIDSGMAPHPYLPAISARELKQKLSTVHPKISRGDWARFCDVMATNESSCSVDGVGMDTIIGLTPPTHPNTQASPIYEYNALGKLFDSDALHYQSGIWSAWRQEISDWLSRQRRGTRPGIPTYRHVSGALRLLSPHSRNFVQSARPFGIMDFDGHGTQMAGIISALRPTISSADVESQFNGSSGHPLMQSTNGLCPYAELVILKCFHRMTPNDEDTLNGSLFDMVDALEYAMDLRLDVLYIGLSAYDLTYPAGQSVTDLLTELRSKGTVIIAPGGNRGKTSPELAFPAGIRSVKAVTAVSRDDTGAIERCAYSARASKIHKQRVAFSAFGGTSENPVVTTNRGSGFTGVAGTSVAAAIATAIYGAAASANYRKQLSQEYDVLVGTGQIDLDLVEAKVRDWVESQTNRDQLSQAIDKACLGINGCSHQSPSDDFGSGVVQMIEDHHLP